MSRVTDAMKNYGKEMEKHFREGRATDEDWAKFRCLCADDSGECEVYQDFCDVVEPHVFGERVECPECGQEILPGLKCWNCGEWTAPEADGAD